MPLQLRLRREPLALIASILVLVLAGCSGRDTAMSEKLARAEAAADRAEAAATRAEAAAKRAPASARDATADEEADELDPAPGDPTSEPQLTP